MIVAEQVFELASSMWEPSDELDREECEIEYVSTISDKERDG